MATKTLDELIESVDALETSMKALTIKLEKVESITGRLLNLVFMLDKDFGYVINDYTFDGSGAENEKRGNH